MVESDGILFEPVLFAARPWIGAELNWLVDKELEHKSL